MDDDIDNILNELSTMSVETAEEKVDFIDNINIGQMLISVQELGESPLSLMEFAGESESLKNIARRIASMSKSDENFIFTGANRKDMELIMSTFCYHSKNPASHLKQQEIKAQRKIFVSIPVQTEPVYDPSVIDDEEGFVDYYYSCIRLKEKLHQSEIEKQSLRKQLEMLKMTSTGDKGEKQAESEDEDEFSELSQESDLFMTPVKQGSPNSVISKREAETKSLLCNLLKYMTDLVVSGEVDMLKPSDDSELRIKIMSEVARTRSFVLENYGDVSVESIDTSNLDPSNFNEMTIFTTLCNSSLRKCMENMQRQYQEVATSMDSIMLTLGVSQCADAVKQVEELARYHTQSDSEMRSFQEDDDEQPQDVLKLTNTLNKERAANKHLQRQNEVAENTVKDLRERVKSLEENVKQADRRMEAFMKKEWMLHQSEIQELSLSHQKQENKLKSLIQKAKNKVYKTKKSAKAAFKLYESIISEKEARIGQLELEAASLKEITRPALTLSPKLESTFCEPQSEPEVLLSPLRRQIRAPCDSQKIANSLSEWDRWSRNLIMAVIGSESLSYTPKDIRFTLGEMVLASVGYRKTIEKIDSLRMQKRIVLQISEQDIEAGELSLRSLLIAIVTIKRLERMSGSYSAVDPSSPSPLRRRYIKNV